MLYTLEISQVLERVGYLPYIADIESSEQMISNHYHNHPLL